MADNPFLQELEKRGQNPFAAELALRQQGTGTAADAFSESLVRRFANNLMAIPSATGDMLAGGGAALEGGAAALLGGDFDFRRRFEEQQQQFPANLIRAIPRPTVQGMAAALRSVPALMPGGETPSHAYGRNLLGILAEEDAQRAAHPIASVVGETTGDIATLFTGRAPFARGVVNAEARLMPNRADIFFGGAAPRVIEPGIRRTVDRALHAELPRRLARGAGRSLETGLEAAALEIINGENADPIEAAAFGAGGQLAGSLLLESTRGLLSGGPLKASAKLGLTALSIGSMVQLLKSGTPAGRDRILESVETGYDKVAYAVMLGALSAALGAPRYRSTRLAEEIPILVDGLASVPRGAALSVLTRYVEAEPDEQATIERVLAELATNPGYKGKTELERKIVRAAKGENYRTGGGF